MRKLVFSVPYAYDYVTPGKSGGTTERCAQALHFASEVLGDSGARRYTVLTAGYTKSSPTVPNIAHTRSLAVEQSMFLNSLGDESVHLVEPSGWGTFDETFHAIRLIKKALSMFQTSDTEIHIVVASNPFHLFGRVALCWWAMKPHGWKVHFVKAHHRYTWKERFQEVFLKIPAYIWKLCVKKEHLTATS